MGLSCGSRSLSTMAFLSSLNLGDAKPRHVCPECKDSGYLERWGTEHGHRRWRCSRCRKTFSETLGTVQYRSRIGRLLVGIGSVLTAADMSVRALAATMGIDKKTALRYRHMMMAELSKRRLPDWLSGHAWVDGTFWPLPGSASVRGRRLMACIAIGRDEHGHLDLAYVGNGYPTEAGLRKAWSGKLGLVTRLTHDDLPCYEDLFTSLGVPSRDQDLEKSTAPGSHGAMGPLERSCSGLKWFLRKHRGISARWLQGYLDLYRWRLMAMSGRRLKGLARMLRGEPPTLNAY